MTEEQLSLMFVSYAKAMDRQAIASGAKDAPKRPPQMVSDRELFSMVGFQPEVINLPN